MHKKQNLLVILGAFFSIYQSRFMQRAAIFKKIAALNRDERYICRIMIPIINPTLEPIYSTVNCPIMPYSSCSSIWQWYMYGNSSVAS